DRLEIAQYHESNDISIRELSELFEVSYQQAYQYVKKYETSGKYGLEDRRGRRKSDSELTETDILKRELELERRKLKKMEVENAFLKKLVDLESSRKQAEFAVNAFMKQSPNYTEKAIPSLTCAKS